MVPVPPTRQYKPPEFPGLEDRLLVVYDGYCGFCNRSIRWFIKRDPHNRLRFAPSESPQVAALLGRFNFGALSPNTLLVVIHAGMPEERLLTRSTGIAAMLHELPKPWPAFGAALMLIPRPLRDLGYRFVARVRYKIRGKYASCPLPTPAERRHFL